MIQTGQPLFAAAARLAGSWASAETSLKRSAPAAKAARATAALRVSIEIGAVTPRARRAKDRYRSIVDLEEHLHRNGTRIIKFFLHLSKDKQAKRSRERIDEPEKNWKFGASDIHERKSWSLYMQAYEACMSSTSTANSPWYVVPADDKKNARLIISQIILDTFDELKMAYPKTTPKRRRELESIRKQL
jgi:hypothetical protein